MSERMGEQVPLHPLTRAKQSEKGRKQSMQHPSLETIAARLAEQLRCEQEDLCRPIVQQVTRGKPVTPAALRGSLWVSQNELEQPLARLSEIEFDQAGNIVGLGAHYFTRNRTRGSDFSLFSTLAWGSPPSSSVAFARISGNGKVLLFVIGRVRFLVKPRCFATRLLA
jgi:hypothetical protein